MSTLAETVQNELLEAIKNDALVLPTLASLNQAFSLHDFQLQLSH